MKNKILLNLIGACLAAACAAVYRFFGLEGIGYALLFIAFCFACIWFHTGECPITFRGTEEDKRAFRDDPFGMATERPPEEDHFWNSFKQGKRPWENVD